jgi:hypothetical protein
MTALRLFAAAAVSVLAVASAAQAAPATGLTGLWLIDQQVFNANSDNTPPLNADAKAKVEAARAAASAAEGTLSASNKKCLPIGMPGMMTNEFALEFLETPGKVTVISENSPVTRTISLTRKAHDPDLEPSWNGDSIGHWEGGTLVVETANLNERISHLPRVNGVASPKTRIVERIHLENGGKVLVNEMTFDSPDILTKPWTRTFRFHRGEPDAQLWEYVCEVDAPGWSERFSGDPEFKPGK